jgi:hypothetical protein
MRPWVVDGRYMEGASGVGRFLNGGDARKGSRKSDLQVL